MPRSKARVALAMDHMRAGRKDEAIALSAQTLREHPDNVDAMRALADIYWRDEREPRDAEALLRRATTLAPGLCLAHG